MSSQLLLHFRNLRLELESITHTLRKNPDPMAAKKASNAIEQHVSTLPKKCAFSLTHSDTRLLQPEYAAFITSLNTLVSVGVAHLRKSDKVLRSDQWSGWVWVCWGFLVGASQAYYKWEEMFRLDLRSNWAPSPSEPDLRNSMTQVLSWILSSSRGGGWTWRTLETLNPNQTDHICAILHVSIQIINNIRRTAPDHACMVLQLSSLPKDYIPLLCCLLCEQTGHTADLSAASTFSPPYNTQAFTLNWSRSQQVVMEFKSLIAELVTFAVTEKCSALLDHFSNPAAIEVLKRTVGSQSLNISLRSQPGNSDINMSVIDILSKLMMNHTAVKRSRQRLGISNSKGLTGSHSFGAEPIPQRAVSHWQLVHVLCAHTPFNASATIENLNMVDTIAKLNLLYAVLDTWDVGVFERPITNTPQCCILLTLAHLCSSLARLWMQSFRLRKQNRACQVENQNMLAIQARFAAGVMPVLWHVMCLVSYFGLQAIPLGDYPDSLVHIHEPQRAQQVQGTITRIPEQIALQNWYGTTGRLAVFESLLRGRSSTSELGITFTVSTVLKQLVMAHDVYCSKGFPACISLVATLRKTLHKTVCDLDQNPDAHPTHPSSLSAQMSEIMSRISEVILSANMKGVDTEMSKLTGVPVNIVRTASFLVGLHPLHSFSLHLQSILLTAVVQISHWRMKSAEHLNLSVGDLQALSDSTLFKYKCLSHGLPELLNTLLGAHGMTLLKVKAKVGEKFGRHASKYFNGRLLPGCCHLGCTNMAGVSEAALPTLLCSGCRRARYCSMRCQREAWIEGGHSFICGE